MVSIEHKPLAVRKRIAMFWTVLLAIALIVLLIVIRTRPQGGDKTASERLKGFYTTVLESGQSYFTRK